MRNKNKNRVFRFNRRIRGLTDYALRLRLLKSNMTRVVVRKSNKNSLVQLVQYDQKGDKIITSAKSIDLMSFGFKGNTGNISAAYLTGYLAGKRALKKGFTDECIVDLGLQHVMPKSRIFAAVKGIYDSGIKLRVSEEIFPDESRIVGEHLLVKDAKVSFEKTKKTIGDMK
ncbi:50S ribosomal protein L18 [bacterium]|nr:50S ribosomal protein L18 [bacterium]